MGELVREVPLFTRDDSRPEELLAYEWLVTNGLGGFASGTLAGVLTRRYHGLLVAALPAPLGRVVMLSRLEEQLELPSGAAVRLDGEERVGQLRLPAAGLLTRFRLESGLPVWRYEADGFVLERRLLLAHRQNTVYDRDRARRFLDGVIASLGEHGVGSVSEIFDAEEPHTPRGCVAQAWSVAEVLRAWVKTAPQADETRTGSTPTPEGFEGAAGRDRERAAEG